MVGTSSYIPGAVARIQETLEEDGPRPVRHSRFDARRLTVAVVSVAAFTAVLGIVWGDPPAGWWDFGIAQWIDHVKEWLILNRDTNWAFVWIFTPFGDLLRDLVRWVLDGLDLLTWAGVLAVATLVALRVSGWVAAVTAAAGLVLVGLLQLWGSAMETVALIAVAVLIAIVIGVPLGVLGVRRPGFERSTKVLLDGMQVLPAYCYLLPMVLLFDIGAPAGVVATVIFALPATIRLTAHGLREVPDAAVEVGTAFGADRRQTLRKIELPMARPALLLGMDQTVNLALGIVVIAALVGSGGLGQDVLDGLQSLNVGQAFEAGLAIVAIAVVFDRMIRGRSLAGQRKFRRTRPPERRRAELVGGTVLVVAVVVVANAVGAGDFPTSLHWSISGPVNDAIEWIKQNVGFLQSVSDFVVADVLTPMRDFLTDLQWWLVAGAFTALGWASGGRRVAVTVGAAMLVIAGLQVATDTSGIWFDTMDTLTQVTVAVLISVAIAVPIGVLAGLNARFLAVIRPLLDAAQVMPAFVYLVPVVFVFNAGRFPGIVASVIYALPLGIRLSALGIQAVPPTTVEAARAMGATRPQVLWKVQLPQAWSSIMLGVNQTILMVFSVVIIAGLVGGGALGADVVYGLQKNQLGLGVEAGIAIVALAIVLDRITQGWGGGGTRTTTRTVGTTRGSSG